MSRLIELLPLHAKGRYPARPVEFTVLEVKTTGLCPGRVVELAAVRVRSDGVVLGEFSTLVNPGPGVSSGWEWAHGINREELDKAPVFGAVLGPLLDLCRGSVLVSHDISLAGQFLSAELSGINIHLPAVSGVSTKDSVRSAVRLPNYRLGTVARAFGIEGLVSQSALSCARVTARLVSILVHGYGQAFATPPRIPALPSYAAGGTPVVRTHIPAPDVGWMADAVERVPTDPALDGTAVGQAYLDLLAATVADQHVSSDEVWSLAALATEAGLSEATVREVHRNFVTALRAVAEGDGVITEEELRDLSQVATALEAQDVVEDLKPAKSVHEAVRVLVLGTSTEADGLRARLLDKNTRLAKKLTASVTHVVHDTTVSLGEPRLSRARELGATVLTVQAAPAALGLVEAASAPAVFVRPPTPTQVPPVQPVSLQTAGPSQPRPHEQAKARPGLVVGGRIMMALGLLLMFVVVMAMFGGTPLGVGIFIAAIGLSFLLGGWLVSEEGKAGSPVYDHAASGF